MTPLQFRLVRILYVARLDGKEAMKRSAKGTKYSRGRISGAAPLASKTSPFNRLT
jgi:hypothetical protein